jgi:hypothetical protein
VNVLTTLEIFSGTLLTDGTGDVEENDKSASACVVCALVCGLPAMG